MTEGMPGNGGAGQPWRLGWSKGARADPVVGGRAKAAVWRGVCKCYSLWMCGLC